MYTFYSHTHGWCIFAQQAYLKMTLKLITLEKKKKLIYTISDDSATVDSGRTL